MFTLLAQMLGDSIILLDYFLRRDVYVKKCENKSNPIMHCNGKCQMIKQLEQAQKNEQNSPEKKMDKKDEVVLFPQRGFSCFVMPGVNLIDKPKRSFRFYKPSRSHGTDIFHPPQS
jgi:hypothetical protein